MGSVRCRDQRDVTIAELTRVQGCKHPTQQGFGLYWLKESGCNGKVEQHRCVSRRSEAMH